MKLKDRKIYCKAEKKTVIVGKNIEAIHMTFVIKCQEENFENYIRKSAQFLNSCDLEKVKTLSINFELLD